MSEPIFKPYKEPGQSHICQRCGWREEDHSPLHQYCPVKCPHCSEWTLYAKEAIGCIEDYYKGQTIKVLSLTPVKTGWVVVFERTVNQANGVAGFTQQRMALVRNDALIQHDLNL